MIRHYFICMMIIGIGMGMGICIAISIICVACYSYFIDVYEFNVSNEVFVDYVKTTLFLFLSVSFRRHNIMVGRTDWGLCMRDK